MKKSPGGRVSWVKYHIEYFDIFDVGLLTFPRLL
jgi:hypothetical protein